ncbi:NTP transferase domain-containing protein [Alphaproteobacteria bacterium LSUCC0684]
MALSTLPVSGAAGAVLAHSQMTQKGRIAKGTRLTESHLRQLEDAGVETVLCAIEAAGDIPEDTAAERLARHLGGNGIRIGNAATGRVNLHAAAMGIVRYNREVIRRINSVDEAITLALVQHNQLLPADGMIATLKIIPFFVGARAIERVEAILKETPAFTFHPLRSGKAWLIQTRFAHQPDRIFAATEKVTRQRLGQLGAVMQESRITSHRITDLENEIRRAHSSGAELILIAGASAITDRDDVIPAGLVAAGGVVDRLGLAVDPGNLLMLGHLGSGSGAATVIGMPGCARSPKLNGLDWVLQLHLAGIALDRDELADMAAGGLLMEIASRPLPRSLASEPVKPQRIAGVLLAAGASRRMGDQNKLLTDFHGEPMIRRIARAMKESRLDDTLVILGHDAEAVAAALEGLDLRLVVNPDYKSGQSQSLRCGVENIDRTITDMMVLLGDMPYITANVIDALLAHHALAENRSSRITLPMVNGQRGNPVIWGRSFFDELQEQKGDIGARGLFESHPAALNPLSLDDALILEDADTPQALKALRKGEIS